MILDDVLAGLDWATERHILDTVTVFGPNGLFKQLNCTVILATNSGNELIEPEVLNLWAADLDKASHLKFAQNTISLDKKSQTAYQCVQERVPIAVEATPEISTLTSTKVSQLVPELSYEILLETERLEDPMSDASRHTGDMKIYAYYAKTVGWWAISVYLFACAVFVFGDIFPCMLSIVSQSKSHTC